MEIFENFSLKNYNTFNLDVKARFFIQIKSKKGMFELLHSNIFRDLPTLIIGEGSNLLFRNNSIIENATIDFRINNSWINENEILNVYLARYENRWINLETES